VIDQTFINYFSNADPIVKTVMLILFGASILSWTLIIQRLSWLRRLAMGTRAFIQRYHDSADLGLLYRDLNKSQMFRGAESVFLAGYKEFSRTKQLSLDRATIHASTERAMQIAINQQVSHAEQNLNVLATIGSISPYIGLFGTVWGIMNAFHALGSVEQATIAMVAPGISEALIATAMGLFAAIPAVIAYNRFTHQIDQMAIECENFQAEFSNLINRQVPATV
jgi:biopolymer transport protein TolQ